MMQDQRYTSFIFQQNKQTSITIFNPSQSRWLQIICPLSLWVWRILFHKKEQLPFKTSAVLLRFSSTQQNLKKKTTSFDLYRIDWKKQYFIISIIFFFTFSFIKYREIYSLEQIPHFMFSIRHLLLPCRIP